MKTGTIVCPANSMLNLVLQMSNANQATAKTTFAVPGAKPAVKIILIATKTIIASQQHLTAGINGLLLRIAAITSRRCV